MEEGRKMEKKDGMDGWWFGGGGLCRAWNNLLQGWMFLGFGPQGSNFWITGVGIFNFERHNKLHI